MDQVQRSERRKKPIISSILVEYSDKYKSFTQRQNGVALGGIPYEISRRLAKNHPEHTFYFFFDRHMIPNLYLNQM